MSRLDIAFVSLSGCVKELESKTLSIARFNDIDQINAPPKHVNIEASGFIPDAQAHAIAFTLAGGSRQTDHCTTALSSGASWSRSYFFSPVAIDGDLDVELGGRPACRSTAYRSRSASRWGITTFIRLRASQAAAPGDQEAHLHAAI
jgi:hypothetical protein